MKNALPKLNDEQVAFICNECGLTSEQLFALDEDTLYETVYEVMCDIEIAEIGIEEDGSDSERCIIASDIVTLLGNALMAADKERYGELEDN